MSAYSIGSHTKKRRGLLWWLGVFIGILLLFLIVAGYVATRWYSNNLTAIDKNNTSIVNITVPEGATTDDVAALLELRGLIRSSTAYSIFIRLNSERAQILAGEYDLSPSMDVTEISNLLSQGENTFSTITFLPASRIDQIRDVLEEAGYSAEEASLALDPSKYVNHPALVDKPPLSNLEGYIYPETFNITPSTPASDVISLALDETANVFTAQLRQDLRLNHNLDLHEAVILASIVEREVNNSEDRSKVAQVFLKRFKSDIALGSDPTALYGALLEGIEPSVRADTLYNTRIYPGLPPGPINNISAESLQAVAYPADTDYLFFVSGDDGKTYFSNTLAEHEALTAKHCIDLCRSY